MKRILLLLTLLTANLYGQFVSLDEAKQLALNYYTFVKSDSGSSRIFREKVTEYQGEITRYTFVFENRDFIVIAADKGVYPVLAYSLENSWSEDAPPAYKDWMQYEYDEWVLGVRRGTIPPSEEFQSLWEALLNNDFSQLKTSATQSVGPLLTTKWGQAESNDGLDCEAYNYYVPVINKNIFKKTCCDIGKSKRCPTGCVPVAMAQIMKYWNSPANGYYWCNMPDVLLYNSANYTSERNAIASLMRDCGIKVNALYCVMLTCQTFAWPSSARSALVNDFGYNASKVTIRKDFSDADWKKMLKNNLDTGKPVFYAGVEPKDIFSAHAWVCDGYLNDLFHFNWGWNGESNGHFFIQGTGNGTLTYSNYQRAIFDIEPTLPRENCNPCAEDRIISNQVSYLYAGQIWQVFPVIEWVGMPIGYNWYYFSSFPISPPASSQFQTLYGKDYLVYNDIQAGTISVDNAVIPDRISVTMKAKNSITLKSFTVEAGGVFHAKIEDCSSADKIINLQDRIEPQEEPEEVIYQEGIKIYPNPVNDKLYIEFVHPPEQNTKVFVYDIIGNLLFSAELQSDKNVVDWQQYSSGMYFITVKTPSKIYRFKLIKQ